MCYQVPEVSPGTHTTVIFKYVVFPQYENASVSHYQPNMIENRIISCVGANLAYIISFTFGISYEVRCIKFSLKTHSFDSQDMESHRILVRRFYFNLFLDGVKIDVTELECANRSLARTLRRIKRIEYLLFYLDAARSVKSNNIWISK